MVCELLTWGPGMRKLSIRVRRVLLAPPSAITAPPASLLIMGEPKPGSVPQIGSLEVTEGLEVQGVDRWETSAVGGMEGHIKLVVHRCVAWDGSGPSCCHMYHGHEQACDCTETYWAPWNHSPRSTHQA